MVFNGLSAFPLTPTGVDGQQQVDVLCRVFERLCVAGVDSIGLLGSTGGYAYLTRKVLRYVMQVAAECVGGRTPLIVGVGALRTDEVVASAQDAAEAGADGLLPAPMSYTPPSQAEVYQHVLAVAEVTDRPL